jgi:hypothetical protein
MSSCFSPPLLLLIAMRAFYELSLWISSVFVSRIQTCTTGC